MPPPSHDAGDTGTDVIGDRLAGLQLAADDIRRRGRPMASGVASGSRSHHRSRAQTLELTHACDRVTGAIPNCPRHARPVAGLPGSRGARGSRGCRDPDTLAIAE